VSVDAAQPFSVSHAPTAEDGVVVIARGEVDMASAPVLWGAIVEALAGHSGQVVLDLSDVSFIDSQGINVLVRVHKECNIDRERLIVRAPQPQARKVLEMTGLDKILAIED
jgi:anti-anti-sigma factor